ncbi:MAG: toll/interleukin-1 receptor domain-containing protein, partial [Lachnospiraceae bacterium]|nr:toll/interleukin-1 receptor domain-containing protein [Lachnospiraceae bacterium]
MQKASFVPYEGDEDYIFISYAHKDAAEVLPIMEKLHDEGYRIWYDDGIAPGSEWPEYIAEHLNACSVMLAMISEASIASANCRREVTYALSKSKTFLSVVLRETQMSPGMELQLSAQQSLLKYRYADEEDFYNKLLNSSVLFPCKRPAASALPETSAAAPSSRKPASAEDQAPDTPRINAEDMSAVKRMTNWEDAKANGASEPWKDDAAAPAAEEKKGAAPGRKKRSALIKVLIIVAAVFAAAFAYNAYSNYRQEQIAARNAENARIAAAAIPQEVFLGKLLTIYSSVSDSNLANAPTMTQTVGDTALELVAMPLTTEVLGEDPEIMLLEFQDIYGEVYSFAARYTLSDGELTLTAPEEYVPVERETETSSEISLPDIEPIIPL